jgi:phosphoribosylanthranilate isomerase
VKILVKICGITNLEDALVCAKAGADMVGFIFYAKSPRYIQPSKAAGIIQYLPASTIPVGVFVNERYDVIQRIIRKTGVRLIQLSGDEKAEECSRFSVPVWKAFRLRASTDIYLTSAYRVDAVMLDGASEHEYGGSGMLADFGVARELKKHHRVVLAGGLTPENAADAVRDVEPYAVDVSSGVEMAPGKKDPHKVRLLLERLKG